MQDWWPPGQLKSFETIKTQRLSGALGAEITGVDLTQDLSADIIQDVRDALLENLVVFIRGQGRASAPDLVRFAKQFGELVDYPMLEGLADAPEVVQVVKLPDERVNFGGLWHSDTTYLDAPPLGSMLLARELPPYGGDTLFANMYLAYQTLSKPMQTLLDGLTAIQSSANGQVSATRQHRLDDQSKAPQVMEARHPAVRTHPETGQKALFVNAAHTIGFEELSEEESTALLGFLFDHLSRPEFTCRFQWSEGALAFWDNRACQHNPINDYHGFKRVMERVTIAGDRPR